MTSSSECPFCHPRMASASLWESAHYRVIADEGPLCVGHVLLLSKEHFLNHAQAPFAYLPEWETAVGQVRRFLLDNFGRASFWENDGVFKDVPHAHMHALPVSVSAPRVWVDGDILKPMQTWEDVWQECQQTGQYCYGEMDGHRYVLKRFDRYEAVLKEMRTQLIAQTAAEIESETRDLKRYGKEIIDETIRLWKIWA